MTVIGTAQVGIGAFTSITKMIIGDTTATVTAITEMVIIMAAVTTMAVDTAVVDMEEDIDEKNWIYFSIFSCWGLAFSYDSGGCQCSPTE